jgi:uncharacterized protein YbjQ (UPF0145 family)
MSSQDKIFCPNCNAEIKSPVLGAQNSFINELRVEFINQFSENNSPNYCYKCYKEPYEKAFHEYDKLKKLKMVDLEDSSNQLQELLNNVPIVTLQYPQDWKYKSLEMVSAQSVTGTGVITEIASSWTDFFGMESGRHNEKLKKGEDNCKSILRMQALQLGGNAILGTDIDYSEAGAGKGMLMVCMAGTAVKITNLNDLNYNVDSLNELENVLAKNTEIKTELKEISKFESLMQLE